MNLRMVGAAAGLLFLSLFCMEPCILATSHTAGDIVATGQMITARFDHAVVTTRDDFAATGPMFRQSASSSAPAATTSIDSSTLDPERQRVLDAVIANLAQHYFDPAVAHQMADALVTHQRHGDDAAATTDKDFAALLTTQMREVSHDLHLEVMYSATPPPQSSPQEFARMLASLQKDNCSFKKVQILQHNMAISSSMLSLALRIVAPPPPLPWPL